MTYLEIVNQVLILMRLDEVNTLEGIEDEAVKVVKQNVNDAKRKVEQAWRWTALREYINVETVQGQANYVVPGTQEQMTIECVLNTTNNYYVRHYDPLRSVYWTCELRICSSHHLSYSQRTLCWLAHPIGGLPQIPIALCAFAKALGAALA